MDAHFKWLPRHLDSDRTSDRNPKIVLGTNLTRKRLGFKRPLQALIAEPGKHVQIRFSCARGASLRNPDPHLGSSLEFECKDSLAWRSFAPFYSQT
jgi:hypothetical protein